MNTGISFLNSVNSAVCRPLLDGQLLTPETTFGLLVDKVGGMTFWKQISQAFITLSFSLFSTFRFFLALFLRATLHYPHAWNRLCKFSMDATCFRVGWRTITFPSDFCHHISVLPCFRYVCGDVFLQDRMINVSEILPLRPIKVNNGKFYLLLRSGYFVNGCVFTRVYVICKICEKLRRIHSCRYLLDLSQSVLQ